MKKERRKGTRTMETIIKSVFLKNVGEIIGLRSKYCFYIAR
jgi:hypothetical protein